MSRQGIVVIGSHVQGLFMRVSRFPGPDETVLGWDYKEALDGGKGSHQAIACARLGLPTYFVGRVGDDRLGQTGADWMTAAGVDLTYLVRSKRTATGCGFVMINPDGISAMTTAMGANSELRPTDIDQAKPILAQARLALITFEIPVATALYAAQLAKQLGAFTVLTPGPAEPLAPGSLSEVDLLLPNQGEASTLLAKPNAGQDPVQLAVALREQLGAKRVVITLGERGALVSEAATNLELPAFKVNVVDTPGAGDAFAAGLAFGLYHDASILDAASFGCLTAARAVTIPESIPGFGTLAEIAEFATANRFDVPGRLQALVGLRTHPAANRD
jgi:ribokinase